MKKFNKAVCLSLSADDAGSSRSVDVVRRRSDTAAWTVQSETTGEANVHGW